MSDYIIGLMSGTSIDSIDVALAGIGHNGATQLVATLDHEFPAPLQQGLRQLAAGEIDSIDMACTLDKQLGEAYAEAVLSLIEQAGMQPRQIRAIGCHGQTIRHCPEATPPYTLQLGSAAVLAELTGITTINDFRSRDIAAGGQGAPLVPAFHDAAFRHARYDRVIVNIGGIANITLLPSNKNDPVLGYDTGPGNTLLDSWSMACRGLSYDDGGDWSSSGQVDQQLLEALLDDDYFSRSPPKSTGTDYFNLDWAEQRDNRITDIDAADVQATLAELTAHSIALAIIRQGFDSRQLYLCGGGAHNKDVIRRLQNLLPKASIASTLAVGIDPDWVEAAAFAWLAWRNLHHLPGNLPSVTGARRAVVLGSVCPA
jgi:anhydro-N-acetylmuramic acid kinase